jgi:hypothetical protein
MMISAGLKSHFCLIQMLYGGYEKTRSSSEALNEDGGLTTTDQTVNTAKQSGEITGI